MFISVLTYLKSPTDHPDVLERHKHWADGLVKQGKVILSGPQASGTGGVIVFTVKGRGELEDLLLNDPFLMEGVADHVIIEFRARAYDPRLWFVTQF